MLLYCDFRIYLAGSYEAAQTQLNLMENSMSKKIAIIGAGPGGNVAAIRAAQMGAEVTLIEK